MRVFKLKAFARFCAAERIPDAALRDAIRLAERGLIDADLGGGVIKQRVARAGQGKSGGYRTIILFRMGERAIYAYGFAKKDRDNIDGADLKLFKKAAKDQLSLDDGIVEQLLRNGSWIEIGTEDDDDQAL